MSGKFFGYAIVTWLAPPLDRRRSIIVSGAHPGLFAGRGFDIELLIDYHYLSHGQAFLSDDNILKVPMESFVKVLETSSLTDITMIKSTLDSHRIQYYIQGENMQFIRPLGQSAVLHVAEKDMKKAIELIFPPYMRHEDKSLSSKKGKEEQQWKRQENRNERSSISNSKWMRCG